MATIYVHNNSTNKIEKFTRAEADPMPYNRGGTLSVREFRGASKSSVLWTDRRVMETWNAFRDYYGRSIFVGFCFKRIWEGGHGAQSQHYAGTSFDTGQNLGLEGRNQLRQAAINSKLWSYVEPASLTPTWVHFDKRFGTPACVTGGYPLLKTGDKGVYVFILQDALNAAGYTGSGLDGQFGPGTFSALKRFQAAKKLPADGIAGCQAWSALTVQVVGMGKTSTVVDP